MRITVIGGGVGCARFVVGLREQVRRSGGADTIDVVVNTADDWWISGLRISPDHDSLLYALAGVNDADRGWGRADESERVAAELHRWGTAPDWFTLGDLDLGTHIARTAWLRAGESVSDVYRRLGARWPLGATLHPATDAEIDTQVVTNEGRIHFQEWWVRHRAQLAPHGFEQQNISSAAPAPGARDAIENADVILLAPSNPIVSIGPVLAVPGMRDLLVTARAPIVGVSGIIDGSVVRGMADACLAAVGIETSAGAVAEHYGSRAAGGILDGWLVDESDAAYADPLTDAGIVTSAVPLWMRDEDTCAQVARDALELAKGLRPRGSA